MSRLWTQCMYLGYKLGWDKLKKSKRKAKFSLPLLMHLKIPSSNVYGGVSPNNSCEACYLLYKLANQLLAKHQTKQKAQWFCHVPLSKYFIYLVVFFWVLMTPKTQMSLHFLPSFLCLPHAQFYWFICSQYCVSQSLNMQTAKLYI